MRGLALLKWGMSSKGEAQRAPSHAGLPPGEGGGGAGQLENQTDKGVVRPAAEGEDTAPQAVQHFTVDPGDRTVP